MKRMKNWVLLAVNAEAVSACAISLAVAVTADDWQTTLVALMMSIACLLWLMLFLSVNKEILTNWLLDGVEKAGHALKKLTRPKKKSNRRDLVIVAFPGSKS